VKPNSKIMKTGRIVIIPYDEEGKVKLLNVERSCPKPCYRGFIEISKYESKLSVINELSLEEYLYAVIPSEMPTNYGEEALKVQAVCARTYAYKQLLQNNYSNYGAHIDDSVASQVYNNMAEDKESMQAVKDTYGEIMLYQNDIIEAYYFSTSWGCTADAKDVWIGEKDSYLEGDLQISKDSKETMDDYDFSSEEAFKKFLNSKTITTYDSSFPWYRWKTTISSDKIQASIEKSIEERYEVNPNLILTLSDDMYISKPISSVGKIEDIEVANRTKNGLINELVIKGSKATIKVCSEYNIRLLLAPLESTIKRCDKSEVDSLNMLPSAFFVVTKNKDTFTFSGGGYGHGVGMSQNGAKAMTEAGFNYSSILQHYYKGATLENLYLS
ncbi:MAG: SpoIID/LytB domain-containing protein, partial [Clostridium sp.]|nr:SpoIID/LytB domain-containing protein [Clostridium sp.]